MTTLAQQSLIAQDLPLYQRTQSALYRVAILVRAEPINQPYTFPPLLTAMNATRSAKRQAMAAAAASDSVSTTTIQAFVLAAANNATIQGEIVITGQTVDTSAVVDADLVLVVAQAWDAVAGVLPSELP